MKKLLSVLALVLLISSVAFAINNYSGKEGDKKDAKKECTKSEAGKSCCDKKTASASTAGAKECHKGEGEKSCCSKKTANMECHKGDAKAAVEPKGTLESEEVRENVKLIN